MSKFDLMQHRAMELAGHVSDSLRHALPHHRHGSAATLLRTGAALGAARAAAHGAGRSIRRHPGVSGTVVAAVVVGVGLMVWMNRRRKEQQATRRAIEGRASRIEQRSNQNQNQNQHGQGGQKDGAPQRGSHSGG